jgi:zinc transport system substrate-binding protein
MSCNALKPLLLAATLLAATVSQAFPKDGVVYTVNYPLQYFAEAIGGDDLEVVFPAPPDVDPADWTPDVDTLLDYQAADLILLNGAGYAEWTKGVYLARSRLVDTSASFEDRLIAEESDEAPHVHGPTGAEVQGAAEIGRAHV